MKKAPYCPKFVGRFCETWEENWIRIEKIESIRVEVTKTYKIFAHIGPDKFWLFECDEESDCNDFIQYFLLRISWN